MQRRAFLASLAGIAAARFAPAAKAMTARTVQPVAAIPEPMGMAVRCVSHYDLIQDRLIVRMDVIPVFGIAPPQMHATQNLLQIDQNAVIRNMLIEARVVS